MKISNEGVKFCARKRELEVRHGVGATTQLWDSKREIAGETRNLAKASILAVQEEGRSNCTLTKNQKSWRRERGDKKDGHVAKRRDRSSSL